MRISKSTYSLKDSSPCVDCYKSMTSLGVKTIVYSTSSGAIVKTRLQNYSPSSYSLGRRFIMNDCHEIRSDTLRDKFIVHNPLDDFMNMQREREKSDILSLTSSSRDSMGYPDSSDSSTVYSVDTHDSEYIPVEFTNAKKGVRTTMVKRKKITIYYDTVTRTQKACFI